MRYWEAKFSLNHIVWEVRMMYDGARTVYARLIIKVKLKKKKKKGNKGRNRKRNYC